MTAGTLLLQDGLDVASLGRSGYKGGGAQEQHPGKAEAHGSSLTVLQMSISELRKEHDGGGGKCRRHGRRSY